VCATMPIFVHKLFCPGWLRSVIFPISAFCIAWGDKCIPLHLDFYNCYLLTNFNVRKYIATVISELQICESKPLRCPANSAAELGHVLNLLSSSHTSPHSCTHTPILKMVCRSVCIYKGVQPALFSSKYRTFSLGQRTLHILVSPHFPQT
jgi:hypothetical protein